ncbi:MAG: hypothetical protein HYZ28_13405 [Myxococcales bacterium]|nr:hypothetical protein [Myxococcales bacterium]
MRRLGAALLLLAAQSAKAAELTRIASSFEEKDPFGMFIDIGFQRTQHRFKLTREHHQNDDVQDVSELRFVGIDTRLNMDLRMGLWEDLEFHYGLPLVFSRTQRWRFANGTSAENSTIYNNCLQADGQLLDPNCPVSQAGERELFTVREGDQQDVFRGGLGDMTFGMAYAIFNQKKDPSKPMWLLGVDYTAPTAEGIDPTLPTSASSQGRIGDRIHRYKFYTSLSRRVGVVDPYFQIHYTLPYRGPGWYSNCDHPDPRTMGRPENCGTDQWTRSDTGIRPPHVGGFIIGSEFNAYEEPAMHQKVAMDIRGYVTYVSEGRYFNELSDVFQKLHYTQDYLQLGGSFGLVAHAAEYVHLKATASLLYNTEHTLTDESIGKDLDGNGTVDISANPKEINPNFDWRTDMVSRRFRATETSIFRIDVVGVFNF